jgi:hypothetical protein
VGTEALRREFVDQSQHSDRSAIVRLRAHKAAASYVIGSLRLLECTTHRSASTCLGTAVSAALQTLCDGERVASDIANMPARLLQ